jgi:hypothetical protein
MTSSKAELAALQPSNETPFPMQAGALAYLKQMAVNSSFPTQDAAAAAAKGFVVRNGSQFFLNGKPYYFIGGNAYWLIDFYTLRWARQRDIDEFLDAAEVS